MSIFVVFLSGFCKTKWISAMHDERKVNVPRKKTLHLKGILINKRSQTLIGKKSTSSTL